MYKTSKLCFAFPPYKAGSHYWKLAEPYFEIENVFSIDVGRADDLEEYRNEDWEKLFVTCIWKGGLMK